MPDADVLIAGAGPVGLTAALELTRRGVRCRVVDPLTEPPEYAKAVGVQPRTLEAFEGMGVLHRILDAAVPLRGQLIYVNGVHVGDLPMDVPADVPFGFVAIPQYATERILTEELALLGVPVERGVRLDGFTQDADAVVATLAGRGDTTEVRVQYLIGADGAHSVVRRTLGLAFEGGAFAEPYMLGDVEVDWSLPRGYVLRAMHQTDGVTDDLLVAVPLPERNRYRMSMLVPADLTEDSTPGLRHIQAVLDRLAPEPTTATNLRWSSVFRISHRMVDSYGTDRVFVAGDAAHIHPPTGAQGMNTGIQDAHNLAWKLALAVHGDAAPGLLATYDAERRPVGEEVVGRTVRNAREGIGAGETDPDFVIRREAQLLIDYAGSPIVAAGAGIRAPDAAGLVRDAVTSPMRLFSMLDRRDHTILFYARDGLSATDVARLEHTAAAAREAAHGRMDVYLLAAPGAEVSGTVLPLVTDADGEFAARYAPGAIATFVVRPDGYLGFAARDELVETDLLAWLKLTFR